MRSYIISIGLLVYAQPGLAKNSSISLNDPNPYETAASDIPRRPEDFRWVVTNQIAGTIVNTEGGPLVVFQRGDPVVVATLPVGTEVKLRSVRVYKGTNYWSITYEPTPGKQLQAWLSGMYIEKK